MASASSTGGQEPAAPATPPASGDGAPKMLGKYQLRKKIGAGGMGAVYLAVDTQLKRTVALKVLPREKATNATLVKRFHAEAQAAAQLKHDNIVTIYEAGEADGLLFIALEYIEGTDVHRLVASRGVLPVKRSLDIIKQVARALQHAHERNIVHRDIKPSNLLIQRNGMVKLTDMGLARTIDDEAETGITRAGMTVGTVDYMAPEQARDSKAADIRSDFYSLGCTWYHMLTGAPPFAEGSLTTKLYNHAAKSRPDPRDFSESIPDAVADTMMRMMARKPAERFQSPDELLAALDAINPRAMSSAEQLLATISDAAEAAGDRADDATASESAADGAVAPRRGKAALPKAPDGDREWLKYVMGIGALGALAVLVLWITSQFGHVFSGGGGVVVERNVGMERPGNDGPDRAAVAPGTTPANGTSSSGGDSPQTSADTDTGNQTATPRDATSPPRPPDRPRRAVSVAIERTTDPQVLEKIGIGREGEKEYVPEWVAEVAEPERPAETGSSARLKSFRVGREGDAMAQFPDLDAALAGLPAEGGVVLLAGDGPFDLNPLQIVGGRQIVIAGNPQRMPVVVLQPDPDRADRPVVTVAGGRLTLLNLQLAATAERFGQEGPVTLFDVRGADLAVRCCSLTWLGVRSGQSAAFRTSPSAEDQSDVSVPSRVLLDRTFVRGSGLTALAAGGTACDVAAVNSLLVSHGTPIVLVTGSLATPNDSRKTQPKTKDKRLPARYLRFLSCTGVASPVAFEFVPGSSGGELPPTGVVTVNSLFATPRSDGDQIFANLRNWPRQATRAAGQSSFANLTWMVRSTVSMGWTEFLRHDGDVPLVVTSIPQWQNEWYQLVEASRFARRLPWPPMLPADLSHAEPGAFDGSTTGVAGVAASDGGAMGCQVASLSTPPDELLRRVVALGERPIVPPLIFEGGGPTRTIPVDLDKNEDLGRIVSSGDWRSGTLFVVSGSGSRSCSPIQVRGKTVRIEFRQSEGQPLQISPRAVNPRVAEQEGVLSDAFISVDEGGRIELAQANIRIPNSATTPFPKWVLAAREGSFRLEGCRIQGPQAGNSRNEGIIRWERPEGAAVRPLAPGRYEQFGEIRDSFLTGTGKLVRADLAGRALIVGNSVLCSTDVLFDVDIRGAESRIHGALGIVHSTLSTPQSFFKITAVPALGQVSLPLRMFVSQTVFAPPAAGGGQGEPTLLSFNSAVVWDERQLEWWGLGNGYTHLLKKYRDGPGAPGGNSGGFESGWSGVWDKAACLRPLTGSGDVALTKNPLPAIARLTPDDFALHASSKAATWTADGKAIGANVAELGRIGPKSLVEIKPPSDRPKGPRKPSF